MEQRTCQRDDSPIKKQHNPPIAPQRSEKIPHPEAGFNWNPKQ